jgi:streptomycin 6-kinase
VDRPTPTVDPGAFGRLRGRFGPSVEPWFQALPTLLAALGDAWGVSIEAPIARGSVSVVFRCRTVDGRGAVLKATPDRGRLALEASALAAWHTEHAPALIAYDDERGALLLEAIEPGVALVETDGAPATDRVADLVRSLHESPFAEDAFPTLARRVDALFDSSLVLYERRPGLTAIVSRESYARGRGLATSLAHDDVGIVLLHGDLTPSNILDGGRRGLVAIDPAPCAGDPAFDAVDLVLWRAEDAATVETRAARLADACGWDARRLLAWCIAFAGMNALELASEGRDPGVLVDLVTRTGRMKERQGGSSRVV